MIAALALFAGLAPLAPQELPLAGYDPQGLHAEAVLAERTRLFLDAWIQADDVERARARGLLASLRRSGAPASAPPSLPALTRAWRSLEGPQGEAGNAAVAGLAALADALDLRAVPGFFAAREQGLGEVVTVAVRRLWAVPTPARLVVTLWWLPPAGAEGAVELRARSEPATAQAFEGAGFEMFVRPPASAPGTWSLVAELEQEGVRVRGVPVPVECLPDPPAAIGLAREVLDDPRALRAVAQGLLACARSGARLPAGLLPSQGTALLQARMRARPGMQPQPIALAFRGKDGREHWAWAWLPAEPPCAVLLLLAPQHEPAEAVFQGELGRLWRAAAHDLSALVLSAHLPRAGVSAEDAPQVLERLRAAAEELVGKLPLVLVSRGDALDALHPALVAGASGCDALIATTPREGEPRAVYGGLSALILAPGGPAGPTATGSGVEWVLGEGVPLLDDPRLAELAASWLPAVLPRAGQAGAEQDGR